MDMSTSRCHQAGFSVARPYAGIYFQAVHISGRVAQEQLGFTGIVIV